MDSTISYYLRAKGIDSFQKLHFLLFLHRQPGLKGTCQELAQRIYFGDTRLLDKILSDLQEVGLVERRNDCYQLRHEAAVQSYLDILANMFENPLVRQELLEQVR